MARIDKLKEEISTYRSKMLYALGFIMMFMAGIGTLYMKIIESDNKIFYAIGAIVLLVLIKISVIIYFRNKNYYEQTLLEIEKE
jgi:hypothetical protein